METIQNIKGQLATMSTEELKSLKSAIVSQLNYRFGNELHEAKRNLYIGAICEVDHPKAYGKQFRVTKINPKNVKARLFLCRRHRDGRRRDSRDRRLRADAAGADEHDRRSDAPRPGLGGRQYR